MKEEEITSEEIEEGDDLGQDVDENPAQLDVDQIDFNNIIEVADNLLFESLEFEKPDGQNLTKQEQKDKKA